MATSKVVWLTEFEQWASEIISMARQTEQIIDERWDAGHRAG